MTDLAITHARAMTLAGPVEQLGLVDDATIVVRGGRVASVAPGAAPADLPHLDVGGRLVTPGLVDCHTHPIFLGDRAGEFALRARGATYQEIAAAGGGILATTAPTRAGNDAALADALAARLGRMVAGGTTSCEAKSGYDLTVAGELRLLRILRQAARAARPRLSPTLLCHVVPAERATDRAAYVAELAEQLVPTAAAAGLCDAIDVYCDDGAFTLDETRRLLSAGRTAGLRVRAHAGQFADLGAVELVAELGGVSFDHGEQLSPGAIAAAAAAGLVAVMLPGACVQLRLPVPPIAALRAAGVPLAIASDLNPGSSHCETLPVQLWLACTHFGMSVEEAWRGVTTHAARVLGWPDIGRIDAGAHADLVVWDTDQPADVPYRYATNLVHSVYIGGRVAGFQTARPVRGFAPRAT